jgi:hypothetical protein
MLDEFTIAKQEKLWVTVLRVFNRQTVEEEMQRDR